MTTFTGFLSRLQRRQQRVSQGDAFPHFAHACQEASFCISSNGWQPRRDYVTFCCQRCRTYRDLTELVMAWKARKAAGKVSEKTAKPSNVARPAENVPPSSVCEKRRSSRIAQLPSSNETPDDAATPIVDAPLDGPSLLDLSLQHFRRISNLKSHFRPTDDNPSTPTTASCPLRKKQTRQTKKKKTPVLLKQMGFQTNLPTNADDRCPFRFNVPCSQSHST